ncbi:MAG: ferrous iron transport protein A [Oscillospiraceae bacterium]|nr:ferrous iron transport protein A [Oscillospiraceae bacterium]MBQ8217705.1 ferrous iron transport protein A [Oscillospiraceae bacterium]
MMPLTFAGIGEENIIRRVGGKPEVKRHLENLGFVAGSDVTVINTIGGNLIVKVKEARVALSQELAQKIMI